MEVFKDINEIEIDGELIGEVRFKPTIPIYIVLACAIALLFVNNIAARILAVFIALIDIFVILYVKDKKVLGVYTKCLLVYDPDGIKACKISNDEIENYDTGTTEQYKIFIKLKNEQTIRKETYRMGDAARYLKQALPNRTTQDINKQKNKEMSFDPVKGVKRLFNQIYKKK